MGALQFFKMVDAHPEAKTHVRIGHLAFSTTTVTFAPMETVSSRDGEVTLRYGGAPVCFDLLRLCEPHLFLKLMDHAHRWEQVVWDTVMTFKPDSSAPMMLQPPAPQEFGDDLPLVALADAVPEPEPTLLSDVALVMVKEMITAEAFSGSDRQVGLTSFTAFTEQDRNTLLSYGLVAQADGEFGEPCLQLVADRTAIGAVLRVSQPMLELRCPPRAREDAALEKLELIHKLNYQGWVASYDAPLLLTRGDVTYPARNVFASKYYFMALLQRDEILSKGLAFIHQHLTQSYYRMLIALKDLSRIALLSAAELENMSDADFKDILDSTPAGQLSLAFSSSRWTGGARRRIQDLNQATLPVPAPPHVIVPVPFDAPIEAVIRDEHVKVLFDGCSHATGNQRAFLYCKRHQRCRLYRFPHLFASRNHCVAFLMAWPIHCITIADPGASSQHVNSSPPQSLADEVFEALGNV